MSNWERSGWRRSRVHKHLIFHNTNKYNQLRNNILLAEQLKVQFRLTYKKNSRITKCTIIPQTDFKYQNRMRKSIELLLL